MPNSWYYRNHDTEQEDIDRIQDNLKTGLGITIGTENDEAAFYAAARQRVVFTWRERYSYERARRHFPFVTNLLVPDIAFQLGPYRQQQQQSDPATDLLVLLRSDHESVYASYRDRRSFRGILETVPGASYLSYSIVDWEDRLHRFDSEDIFFTDTAIQLLSSGRVVICDRLHAAILAYLTGLYFVYLDQESGKITKTLTVAMESGKACQQDKRWSRAYNLTDAVHQAVVFMDRYQLKSTSQQLRRERRRRKRNQQQASP
jgi:exopolysaccharide biosynthesis predicted pyruvyltransferase EpsI